MAIRARGFGHHPFGAILVASDQATSYSYSASPNAAIPGCDLARSGYCWDL
ncbi:hypothetical protein J5X98_12030 [Leptothermofonsia sichuanensis E412]|uniref:hypothetical protein n=1 Tax=Leptothermofonsia sichuanensis TaxID=2917832 RepID=UPI001CA67A18|nr:hypothetical protein [Leptothermofonsia sichuanensis]QZZ23004.1 hypothetical protein J5X98_12030 [Leptothermofonsia sichuanensis E412]